MISNILVQQCVAMSLEEMKLIPVCHWVSVIEQGLELERCKVTATPPTVSSELFRKPAVFIQRAIIGIERGLMVEPNDNNPLRPVSGSILDIGPIVVRKSFDGAQQHLPAQRTDLLVCKW